MCRNSFDDYLAKLTDDYLSECTPQYTDDGDYAPNCDECNNTECEYYYNEEEEDINFCNNIILE